MVSIKDFKSEPITGIESRSDTRLCFEKMALKGKKKKSKVPPAVGRGRDGVGSGLYSSLGGNHSEKPGLLRAVVLITRLRGTWGSQMAAMGGQETAGVTGAGQQCLQTRHQKKSARPARVVA